MQLGATIIDVALVFTARVKTSYMQLGLLTFFFFASYAHIPQL